MPESTSQSNQSPQEVFSSSGSEQWSQGNSSNIVMQNRTNLQWSQLQNPNVVPETPNIANTGFVPNVANNNISVAYNAPPNYVNIPNPQPYQRYTYIQNGYPAVNIPNAQSISGETVTFHNLQRPSHPNTWATQQNIKLIQTAWNKTNSGGIKKQKRVRTAFTSHQMMELEQEYARTRYLDRTRRIELADILRLNERTIKIWFQNRRMKEKKDRTESLEEIEDVSTTQSPPEHEVPAFHVQYQANSEPFNRMGVFIEEYPVSSTSMSPMPQAQMLSYPTYGTQEENSAQHQQVYLQVQQYPSPYCEVQELTPKSTDKSESSVSADTTAPSDITEKNWDLSWLKSIQTEEE